MAKITGVTLATLVARGGDFQSTRGSSIELALEGVIGDSQHFGFTRKSSSREPWHPRGTQVKNDRQLSIVSTEELIETAQAMEIPRIDPEWIGANIMIAGVPQLSFLPRGTRLLFPSGATIFVADQNAPCRHAGAAINAQHPERKGLDLLFPKKAGGKRGVVAFVERAGIIREGDPVTVMLPMLQWVYEPKDQTSGSQNAAA
jgi:MOSC domain-containing protein YiiM